MNIIVGAVLSIPPFSAGMVWNWMHLVIGLKKLGHFVIFVEEVKPAWLVDSAGTAGIYHESANRRYFLSTMERFGLAKSSCQIYNNGEDTAGMPYDDLLLVASNTDLLINMSGHVRAEAVLERVRHRVYVDQDPVYTQLWLARYGATLNVASHETMVSVGLNIGTSYSDIPDGGIDWKHTLPPVVPELWQSEVDAAAREFTTIASWSTYGDLEYRGRWYRSKYDEFKRFSELPTMVDQPLSVRLKCFKEGDVDIQRLRAYGWHVAKSPDDGDTNEYQEFIRTSRAEIGIAKGAYVVGQSGWFGDRWAHFLVAGKPVLAQSTGFERHFPVGRGLLSFSDIDEAAAGIEAINSDYTAHCLAAREFAEEYLSYSVVLPKLISLATEKF